jgi:hypothetical protein
MPGKTGEGALATLKSPYINLKFGVISVNYLSDMEGVGDY